MYGGAIVESGTVEKIFYEPEHEYTKELLRCVRSLSDESSDLYVSSYAGTSTTGRTANDGKGVVR
jgi:ABC-type dipeptide/oligopeptide/nickel transport system ATPase component